MRIRSALLLLVCLGVSVPARAAKPPYLNAADFPSIQAAVDALGKQGGTVMIPPGVYDESTSPAFVAPLRLPPAMHVRVVGAGREATTLQSKEPNRDLCRVQGSFQSVENLTFTGAAHFGSSGRGNGVVVASGGKSSISNATLRDVVIRGAPRFGLDIRGRGSPSDSLAILCTYDNVFIDTPDSGAVSIERMCTTQFFRNCTFIDFKGFGARVQGVGHQFANCDFEQSPNGPPSGEFLLLDGCKGADIRNCWFEDQRAGRAPAYFVHTRNSTHINVDVCTFTRFASNSARGILIEPPANSVTITNPLFGAYDSAERPFNTKDQITVRGYAGSLSDDRRASVTLIGGSAATARYYYPVSVTDSLRSGERPQPGVVRLNPQGK